jgi:hypothetical protein
MDTWKIEDLQARAAAQYHGNVEINAHEDALALDVDVSDRLLVEHALRIGRHLAKLFLGCGRPRAVKPPGSITTSEPWPWTDSRTEALAVLFPLWSETLTKRINDTWGVEREREREGRERGRERERGE